jgi:hypothetical protein
VWCGLALDMGPRIAEWEILWYRLRLLGYSRRGLLHRVLGNVVWGWKKSCGNGFGFELIVMVVVIPAGTQPIHHAQVLHQTLSVRPSLAFMTSNLF